MQSDASASPGAGYCQTLCDPMDCSLLGSSIHGFPRQEYWSGLSFPSPGDLSDPRIKPVSPALVGRFFITEPGADVLQVSPTQLQTH